MPSQSADSRKNVGLSTWFRRNAFPFAINQVASGMRLVLILQQAAALTGSPSGFFAALTEAVRVRGGWRGFLVTFAVYQALDKATKSVQVSPVFGFSPSVSFYLRLVLIHPLQVLTIAWVVHGRNSVGHTVSHLAPRSALDWVAGVQYSLLGNFACRFIYFKLNPAPNPKPPENVLLACLKILGATQIADCAAYPLYTAALRSMIAPDSAPWSVGVWWVGCGTLAIAKILSTLASAILDVNNGRR